MIQRPRFSWIPCLTLSLAAILSLLPLKGEAQKSTAPPSSLPTIPLSPNGNAEGSPSSCELCRELEGRPGSDLKPQRRYREKDLHPNKKAKGISKSSKRSLMNQLPHHKLEQDKH